MPCYEHIYGWHDLGPGNVGYLWHLLAAHDQTSLAVPAEAPPDLAYDPEVHTSGDLEMHGEEA